MPAYNFDVRITTNPATGATTAIDTECRYGYWERRDGSEGGGLWFVGHESGKLELIDYDGATELPQSVVKALRDHGFILDSTFDLGV